jgi:hypothetical protein
VVLRTKPTLARTSVSEKRPSRTWASDSVGAMEFVRLVAESDLYGVAFFDRVAGGRALGYHGVGGRLRGRDGWLGGGGRGGSSGCCRGCGWRGELFGADDVEAGGGGSGGGLDEGEAGEGGHDELGGGFGVGDGFGGGIGAGVGQGCAEQEADARAFNSCGGGSRGLGEDDAGGTGGGDVSDGSEFEAEAADGDGGGTLGLADEGGDGDLLWAEAFGDADGPLAADDGVGSREL